jgi:hypothetical protein
MRNVTQPAPTSKSGDTVEPSVQSLAARVTEIERRLIYADEAVERAISCRVQAGKLLLALRARIEAGEAGQGVSWWQWYGEHFDRSRRDGQRLMALASSPDPEAAAAEERAKTRAQVAQHRKQAARHTVCRTEPTAAPEPEPTVAPEPESRRRPPVRSRSPSPVRHLAALRRSKPSATPTSSASPPILAPGGTRPRRVRQQCSRKRARPRAKTTTTSLNRSRN